MCAVGFVYRREVFVPQAVWTGHLSFGLVNIPVKLYSATSPKDVRFHQYDAETGRRVRYRRVIADAALDQAEAEPPPGYPAPSSEPPPGYPAPSSEPAQPGPGTKGARDDLTPAPAPEPPEEREVLWEDVVKGFEVEPGRVVTVTPEELMSIAPERSRELAVEQFVSLEDIDPVYFEKSYYMVPQPGMEAERPYWLLYRAMQAAGEVAVGRFVLRTKEYLAVVRPAESLLVLETLFYADEVRDPKELWIPPAHEPPEQELRVARQFIEALAGEWEATRHRDEYRQRVLDLLQSKGAEAFVEPEAVREEAATITDLMEALEASVEAAKQARDGQRRTG
jgi:DNA end-binding protein Ku